MVEISAQGRNLGAEPLLQGPDPFRRVDVKEIVRATALAIRRRNELLGPLGAEDDDLASAGHRPLARHRRFPNHWSRAWADLLLGLAHAGVGKDDQARKPLNGALLVAGQYDHPLTCVAMLELGRIEMDAGNTAAAADLLSEASYSAFYYEDLGVIDDAFRLGSINRLASGVPEVGSRARAGRSLGESKSLSAAGCAGESRNRRAIVGARRRQDCAGGTGARQASRLRDVAFRSIGQSVALPGRVSAVLERSAIRPQAALAKALAERINISSHNLQLQLANQRYDQQQLRARSAVGIYQTLLSDPPATEWMFRPLETLARLKTPHGQAFDRWLDAVLSRKDMASALEISDLAKAHRYHSALAWGGRLAALRDVLEKPDHLLSQQARNQRNELLLRYPEYREASQLGMQLRRDLSDGWQVGIDAARTARLGEAVAQLEQELGAARGDAWARLVCSVLRSICSSRRSCQRPVCRNSSRRDRRWWRFTRRPAVSWASSLDTRRFDAAGSVRPKKVIAKRLGDFLRALGNYDANHAVPIEEAVGRRLARAGRGNCSKPLFTGSSLDVTQLDELIVVPDGLVWYVPMAALPVEIDGEPVPLITKSRVRLAPTVGLAVGNQQPWRRVRRTGIVGLSVLPGESDEEKAETLAALRKTTENPIVISKSAPAPTPLVGAMTDTLIVLDEIELDLSRPLDWSPISQSRGSKQSSLSHWLTLPQVGPQRIIMPAARTVAERGGKISKRRGAAAQPGSELFLASCGLMSTGAQTILLSNWRVGGDATLELTREFLQELPYTSADAAWQRSVQVTRELPLSAEQEPRVKVAKNEAAELTAAHPFFWAGYQLIDSGAPAADDEDEEKAEPVAQLRPSTN